MGALQGIAPDVDPTTIADAVWEEPADEHLAAGTMGKLQTDGGAGTGPLVVPSGG